MNRREISRGIVPLLAVLLLPVGGASPAEAEWLVTREGGRVEIQGKPQVKGKLVVFTRADGTLASLRLSEVDLEASERVTAEEKEKKETGVVAQEPAKKKSVASVTDDNLVRTKKPEPPPGAAPSGEAAPAADAPAPSGPATVGTWKQQDLPGGNGMELIGSLENKGDKIATGLALTVQLYNETGQLLATGQGILMGGSIPPGGKLDFKVPFPGLFTFSDAKFQVKSWPLDLNPVPEAPAEGEASPL
jgi:hypothetical protein